MTAGRFEKGKEECAIGPGSYELPTTLDEHGMRITGTERFAEGGDDDVPGPGFLEDVAATATPKALTRTPSKGRKGLAPSSKENRGAQTPGAQDKFAPKKLAMGGSSEARELEQLKKQLTNEERLRLQAEGKAADLVAAKKWASEAQLELTSKDKKLESMQKKMEEITAQNRESQTKLRGVEADEAARRKVLLEKDQAAINLQKGLEQQKVLNAKLKEQCEKGEADVRQKAKALETLTEDLKNVKAGSTRSAEEIEQLRKDKETAQRELDEQRSKLTQAGVRMPKTIHKLKASLWRHLKRTAKM